MREALADSVAALRASGAVTDALAAEAVPESLVQAHIDIAAVEAVQYLAAETRAGEVSPVLAPAAATIPGPRDADGIPSRRRGGRRSAGVAQCRCRRSRIR